MSNDTLTKLVLRLESAERELAATQVQVRALQAQPTPRSRSRRDAIVVLLGLVLMFTVSRALDTHAQAARPQVLTVKAPFQVMDGSGKKVIMSVIEFSNGTALTFGDPAAGGVVLGVGPSGDGFMATRGSDGKKGSVVGIWKGRRGMTVLGPDGITPQASLGLSDSDKGALWVGDDNAGGAHIGVGNSGAGYLTVRRAEGKMGVAMGQLDGRPMSVGVFGENAKELASLRADTKGGSVLLMNPTGVSVAGVLGGDTGGSVALTGPAGGKSAVSLSVDATGGKVRVFPQGGGSAQAELTAEATGGGAVTVYSTAGEPVGLLQATSTGAGRFEISKAGQIYVEAGVLPSGLGVVRAGPQIGGPPVGLGIPNAIMGKSGH
jgi:hypothetical protein